MPRVKCVNLQRHAVTLPHGQPVGAGEAFEAENTSELQSLVADGTLFLVEHIAEPAGEPTPVQHDPAPATGLEHAPDVGIPDESVLGQAEIQHSPPPEQPVEPSPPGEPLETEKTTSRSRGRKGGDRA